MHKSRVNRLQTTALENTKLLDSRTAMDQSCDVPLVLPVPVCCARRGKGRIMGYPVWFVLKKPMYWQLLFQGRSVERGRDFDQMKLHGRASGQAEDWP